MRKSAVIYGSILIGLLVLDLVRGGLVFAETAPLSPFCPAGSSLQVDPAPAPRTPYRIRAWITDLTVETGPTGAWIWKAAVENTDKVALDGRELILQGYSHPYPFTGKSWTPASGSIVRSGTLAPRESVEVVRRWDRCCLTTALKIELRDRVTDQVIDSRVIYLPLHSTRPLKPFDVSVKRIEWDKEAKTWKATVRNDTDFTLKIGVQGYLWSKGVRNRVPAGGQQVLLRPHAEGTTMALHAPGARIGDNLHVHIGLATRPGTCNETWEDCGGKQFKRITVPTSANF